MKLVNDFHLLRVETHHTSIYKDAESYLAELSLTMEIEEDNIVKLSCEGFVFLRICQRTLEKYFLMKRK